MLQYTHRTTQEIIMKFTLITSSGKIRTFYVQAVAELYQVLEGGVIVTADTIQTNTQKTQEILV